MDHLRHLVESFSKKYAPVSEWHENVHEFTHEEILQFFAPFTGEELNPESFTRILDEFGYRTRFDDEKGMLVWMTDPVIGLPG